MSSLVQSTAPDFTAMAVMPDGRFQHVTLSDYRGRYVVLFFYPLDFTFVCPTEVIAFSDGLPEFERRHVQLLGVSVDSHYAHYAWRKTPRDAGGIGEIRYPLLSDLDKQIASRYGILLPDGIALRGLFLIDGQGIVRHQLVNDLPLGRSVEEVLRVIDAWQFHEKHGEVCPANWKSGQKTLTPSVQESRSFFESNYSGSA